MPFSIRLDNTVPGTWAGKEPSYARQKQICFYWLFLLACLCESIKEAWPLPISTQCRMPFHRHVSYAWAMVCRRAHAPS